MSEHSISRVQLDVLPATAGEAAADAVRDWLLGHGIIAANNRVDPLRQSSAWMPAPKAREVADDSWFDTFLVAANNGVNIVTTRDCYYPHENETPPACRLCSLAPTAYYDHYWDWVGDWLNKGREPEFTCRCGWAAPLGDWIGQFSVAVGAPAITSLNWPDLDPGFIDEGRTRLGARTAVVRSHW